MQLKFTFSAIAVLTCAATPVLNAPYGHLELIRRQNGTNDFGQAKAYLGKLQHNYEQQTRKILHENRNESCSMQNLGFRRAWDDLNEEERSEYIRAVHCVAEKPARTNRTEVPGARNWIDDFVWQHITQTNFIHISGLLLPWHRQFLFAWEQTLRNECGYKGYLPYWPWERHADNQSASPMWHGNNSFGGNGAYIPHGTFVEAFVNLPSPLNLTKLPGTGGGYVEDGAFGCQTGWTLNIGPISPVNNTFVGTNNTVYPNNTLGQQYNPRCLRRDFTESYSSQLLNYSALASLMQADDIHGFHQQLELDGVHLGGHFFVGIEGGDIYASPNEPSFWLHHSSVDRLWAIWQAQDFANRGEALDGTVTIANIPPSDNATLDTIMQMGIPAGGEVPIREAMSPTANGHCYMYV